MSEHTIQATGRNVEGKSASRRLRRAASLPAIVYGGKSAPLPIQLDHEKIWQASQHEWFYSSILNLEIDGKTESVLLRDMQRHPFRQLILHLDFQRVEAGQTLRAYVQLHLVNADVSPAGKVGGVVIMHELTQVEVSCLPKDLPAAIEVDISDLEVGGIVHLSQVKLPKGVEIPSLKLGKEHDVAVVVAKHGRVEEEAVAEPEALVVPTTKVEKKDEK